MSDYISREDAIKSIYDGTNMDIFTREVKETLESLPSADVRENIKGEWKRISPAGIYECSCCGQYVMTSDIECYKFCHGCGADMRGE